MQLTSSETAKLKKPDETDLTGPAMGSELQALVALVARMLDASIALVTVTGKEAHWFVAKVGLNETGVPRDEAIINHCIAHEDVFVLADATAAPQFATSPIVEGTLAVRFYAGAPIIVDGQVFGSVCVLDRKPRELGNVERKLLQDAAAVIAERFTWGKTLREAHSETSDQAQNLETEFHELTGLNADVPSEQSALSKLAISEASLKQVASLASHDLHAPLRQIGILADILVEDHADQVSEEAGEIVLRMQKIAGKMRTLVRELHSIASSPNPPEDQ